MDEKNPTRQTEFGSDRDDDARSTERVYDVDSDAAEPVEEGAGKGGGDEAVEPVPGRRVSRKEILGRFQQKNQAITRLTREKTSLEKEKAGLVEEVKEMKDRWLRSAAEFENYRKRSAREWDLLKQQSKSEVILEVLNSLDDFERAFAAVEGTEEPEFIQGIRLIYSNLLQSLQKLGVAELKAHHQPFDPNVHMAVGQIESTEAEPGHVVEVVQKGYSLDGVLIRPARVIVAK